MLFFYPFKGSYKREKVIHIFTDAGNVMIAKTKQTHFKKLSPCCQYYKGKKNYYTRVPRVILSSGIDSLCTQPIHTVPS